MENVDKFCVNCKHHIKYNIGANNEYDKCFSPKNGYDQINGKIKESYCRVNRMAWLNDSTCSKAGNWFEPKDIISPKPKISMIEYLENKIIEFLAF